MAMNEKMKARIAAAQKEKEDLFQAITYGSLCEAARRKIFEQAWDLGHSSGGWKEEVELYYNDLTELVEGCVYLQAEALRLEDKHLSSENKRK